MFKERKNTYEETFGEAKLMSELSFDELMNKAANCCWNNVKGKKIEVLVNDVEFSKIVFEGTILETIYEYFEADTNVYLIGENGMRVLREVDTRSIAPYKKEVVETGSKEEARAAFDAIKSKNAFVKYL